MLVGRAFFFFFFFFPFFPLPLVQDDDFISYCGVEVFDNASSNFSKVVLGEVFPFVSDSLDSGRGVLVHDKTGRSKGPAVVVAFLMMRFGWTLMEAMKFLVPVCRPKVSDHLLGKLLLLGDARQKLSASMDLEVRAYTDDLQTLSFQICEAFFDQVAERVDQLVRASQWGELRRFAENDNSSIIVRRALWNRAKEVLGDDTGGEFGRRVALLAGELPPHCYAVLQSAYLNEPALASRQMWDFAARDLASALHRSAQSRNVDSLKGAFNEAKTVVGFLRVWRPFFTVLDTLARERCLQYYYTDDIAGGVEWEAEVVKVLGSNAKFSGPHVSLLKALLTDLERNVKPLKGERGRVLYLNAEHWGALPISPPCQLPRELRAQIQGTELESADADGGVAEGEL